MFISLQVQDHTFIRLELWSSDLWQQEKPKLHHRKQWGLWGLFHHLPHDHRSREDRVGQQNTQKNTSSTCYFKDILFAPPFLVLVFTKQNFVTFIVNKLCIFFSLHSGLRGPGKTISRETLSGRPNAAKIPPESFQSFLQVREHWWISHQWQCLIDGPVCGFTVIGLFINFLRVTFSVYFEISQANNYTWIITKQSWHFFFQFLWVVMDLQK